MTIVNAYILTERTPPRKRFTRAQFHWLFENGLFDADHSYELIEGDIVEKMGQKEPHPSLVMQWIFALAATFGQAFVRGQAPVVLNDHSEPEPDIIVTAQPSSYYRDSRTTPPAMDVRLAIEVSLTTLAYDLGQKSLLYAASGIPEYWVSDVAGRHLIVHREPTAEGYASIVTLAETESVSPLAAPTTSFAVVDFLP